MKNWKKLAALVLTFAMLAAVSACGKQQEPERTMPEDTTEVTTTAEEETDTDSTTTAKETTTAASTTTTGNSTETTSASTTTAAGETTAAGAAETTAAETQAQTEAPAAVNTTQAPAADPTPAPAEEPSPSVNTNAPEMSFTSGGMTVNVGESALAFVSGVGYNSFDSSPSCLGNGEDIVYRYDDYTLFVWNDNDSYRLIGIDIQGGDATTSRGIKVGSSVNDVTAAYGTGYTEENSDYVYRYDNNCSLRFTIEGGTVTFISYNQDN